MLIFAVEGAAHSYEGFGEWKDIAADQQVIVLGSDRMPKHAFRRNRHLGNQVRPCQSDAPGGGASQLVVTSKHGKAILRQDFTARTSKDNRMHVCMRRNDSGDMDVICFFVPPGA